MRSRIELYSRLVICQARACLKLLRDEERPAILTKYGAEYQLSLFPTRRTSPLRIRSSVRVPLTPPHARRATRSRRGQLTDFAKAPPWFAASLQRSFRSAGELERS